MLIRTSFGPCFLATLACTALVVACGAEPQRTAVSFEARPTPTPDAMSTPAPTVFGGPRPTPAVSTPTPTPEPSPTPEPPAALITDWNLDASSTGADLLALVSEDERSCMETTLGDRFDTFRNAAFFQNLGETTAPALDCLTPESNAGFAVWMYSATAGGLSAETRSCLADVFTADPRAAPAFAGQGAAAEAVPFDVLSCLTPEEAAAMTPEGEGPSPDTEGLRCLIEELGKLDGGEEVGRILSTADPGSLTPEQGALLGQAVAACGIETEFTFPAPGSTSPDDGSAATDGETDTPFQQ